MTITFTQKARFQIEENARFIAADKPIAARKWADGVQQAVCKLKEFPCLGRQVPEYANDTLRELLYGDYRIVYQINIELSRIEILSVFHSKQLLWL
ncbi:MAG: type II toxin-antitoxin system RelE/ParE family toxin [Chlorobium sp.]|jgi:plasmid stabilization system protein ParE|nr:type II toxin-antitoxin system RelE/ParE family toxin [Chlorobium sp.]